MACLVLLLYYFLPSFIFYSLCYDVHVQSVLMLAKMFDSKTAVTELRTALCCVILSLLVIYLL